MTCPTDSGGLARAACEREANRSAAFLAAAQALDARVDMLVSVGAPSAIREEPYAASRFRRGIPTADDVTRAVSALADQALEWYGDPAKAQSRARAIRAIQYLKGVQV